MNHPFTIISKDCKERRAFDTVWQVGSFFLGRRLGDYFVVVNGRETIDSAVLPNDISLLQYKLLEKYKENQ
jgi:hypothetical protein